MKKFSLLAVICVAFVSAFSQTIIGTTTYDVQTNNGSKNHLVAYDDGSVSAVWTGSINDVGNSTLSAFSDRGTFYNHYDGSSWGAYPTTRIESVRTGFNEIIPVGDHEVVTGHYFDGLVYSMKYYANDAVGSSTWTETAGSSMVTGLWGFSYCPDGTDDIYTVCSNANPPAAFNFSRSDDGGATWSVLNSELPYLSTADGIPYFGGAAESYQIAAHGSDVYVLFGMPTSDLVLLHSGDYGNSGTWERTNVIDFPYDNFDGTVQTDIDGDFITDTLGTNDGYHEMLITDDGTLHIFSGYVRIYSDGFGYIMNYKSSGIWHWSTGMPAAEVLLQDADWSTPDCIYNPYGGIGVSTSNYRNAAMSSEPAASYDPATGRVYLLFTKKIEYSDLYSDPLDYRSESYRDIFGSYSDDGGATWSTANNMTNTAALHRENFYLFAADKAIDGNVLAIWQEDSLAGQFNEYVGVGYDTVHLNNMMYQAFTDADFIAPVAEPDFTHTVDLYTATFTDASSGATCYSWDFGDGTGTSTLASPAYTYASGGTYTVCLTVSNSYGSETYCEDVSLVSTPAADFSFTGDPVVDFTDLSSNAPTSWSWDFDDGGTSTDQNPSHTYLDNGLYNVCLTATNLGGSNTSCQNVAINLAVQAPVVDFTFTAVGLVVSFNDISTNAPTSWSWNFDDGATSTDQNPSHTYATGGDYSVCLQAGNAGGIGTKCIDIQLISGLFDNAESYITVYPNPASEFVQISSDLDLSDMVFELYNAGGQKTEVTVLHTGTKSVSMNVKEIASGNYMLKITSGDQSESRMITVN